MTILLMILCVRQVKREVINCQVRLSDQVPLGWSRLLRYEFKPQRA